MKYTEEQVLAVLNRAADDILEAVDAGPEGLADAMNLVVNASATYLRNPKATLRDAIQENYDLSEDDPLDWIVNNT